jgi:Tol biopolymer transport system component
MIGRVHRAARASLLSLSLAAVILFASAAASGTDVSSRQRDAAADNTDIVVIEPDGSGRANLTKSPEPDDYAVWSPDGTRIAFDRFFGRRGDILVVGADGTGLRDLTNRRRGWDEAPSWSPDGNKIVFQSVTARLSSDIFVMSADGGSRVNLTHSEEDEFGPLLSPNGQLIVFQMPGLAFGTDIFVMNADGTGRKKLTRNGDAFESFALAWSPDSSTILYSRTPVGLGSPPSDLWVMRPDGSGKRNLTPRPASVDDVWGAWSPDGTKIVFASDRRARKYGYDIYVMNADGRRKVNLTKHPAYDFAPAWSPDGSKIAFASNRGSLKNSEIMLMNVDGTRPINVTQSPREDVSPLWSPDGRQILFLSKRPQFCLVPRIVGMLLAQAQRVLSRANCQPGGIRRVQSRATKDRVLRQNPGPGTRLPYGAYVNLVISAGEK